MFSRLIAGLFVAISVPGLASGAELINAVAFENGAVLRSYTDEFGDRASPKWIALALVDGDPSVGWASAQGAAFPHEFVIELATDFELNSLLFDNRNSEEDQYPGISATGVSVAISITGPDGPFEPVFSGSVEATDLTEIALAEPVTARWVRLSIEGNGGRTDFTELMEFSVLGTPTGPGRSDNLVSATYDTNWNPLFLIVENGELRGCYDHDNGVFSGSSAGEFLNIEWREDGDQVGKAVLAITEDGSFVNGFWYEGGALKGTWFGPRADDSLQPDCAAALLATTKSAVEQALDQTGRAVLYGIYFDFNSDVIKPESEPTLMHVLQWLSDNPGKNVVFEGHTDSDGSEDYNRDLSTKRATAVVNWLVTRGIAVSRMGSSGFGEDSPVADNVTAQGRALNRRVEVGLR